MKTDRHPGRGGRRTAGPGKRIGRPAKDGPKAKTLAVTLYPDDVAFLKTINPKLSAAIRILIARSASPAPDTSEAGHSSP